MASETNPQLQMFQGYTPLHLATIYNHNDVVLLLVDDYGKIFFLTKIFKERMSLFVKNVQYSYNLLSFSERIGVVIRRSKYWCKGL